VLRLAGKREVRGGAETVLKPALGPVEGDPPTCAGQRTGPLSSHSGMNRGVSGWPVQD
jgi:hypothetical protein